MMIHRSHQRLLALVLLASLSLLTRTEAAMEVIEIGPALTQQTITAVQSVLSVANQIIDLTPLEEIIALEGFMEDMAAIEGGLLELRGLGWDISSLDGQFERLFSVEGLPESSAGMSEWKRETSRSLLEMRHDAMRIQTLVRTILRTVRRMAALMESIGRMIGNLQISQTASQAQNQVVQLMTENNLVRAVHERAEDFEGASDVAETEMLHKINCNIWRNWPGMTCE